MTLGKLGQARGARALRRALRLEGKVLLNPPDLDVPEVLFEDLDRSRGSDGAAELALPTVADAPAFEAMGEMGEDVSGDLEDLDLPMEKGEPMGHLDPEQMAMEISELAGLTATLDDLDTEST